ncbi:MAG: hypothetical protein ACXVBW_11870, partial [Bdellovibrionota bacterium]
MAIVLATAGGMLCPASAAYAGSEEHEFLLFDSIPLDEAEAMGSDVSDIRHKLRETPNLTEIKRLVPDLDDPVYEAPPVKDAEGNVIDHDFTAPMDQWKKSIVCPS